MICKNCGAEIVDENAQFCNICGQPINDDGAADDGFAPDAENTADDGYAPDTENTADDAADRYVPQPEISTEDAAPAYTAPQKKGAGGIIAAAVILCAVIAGLFALAYKNSNNSAVDTTAIEKENPFEKVKESSVITDFDEVVTTFDAALDALDSADSVKIDTVNMNKTDNSSQQLRMYVERMKEENQNQLASVSITQKYTEQTEQSEGETGAAPEPVSEENSVEYYYADGMLYVASEDSKLKMEVSNDDILAQLNSYSLDISKEYMEKASCEKKGRNKRYIVSMDKDGYQAFMLSNMAAQGAALADDETMQLNYSNLMFEVDGDGVLVKYAFVIDLTDTIGGEATNYKSTVTVSVSDYNKTTVEKRAEDELADYLSQEEYIEKLQNEQQSDEAAEETTQQ